MARNSTRWSRNGLLASGGATLMLVMACGFAPPSSPATAPPSISARPLAPLLIEAIAVDGSGVVYGSDCFRNAIFRFADGQWTVVAGTGAAGFSGDGGPAASAELFCPSGLASAGADLYVVDDGNNRLRKVDGDGIITTVAGSRPSGTRRGSPYEGGIQAAGLAIDGSGNFYVADRDNHVVRRIDAGGVITTVAGNGERGPSGDGSPATVASISVPIDVVIDDDGHLYVSSVVDNQVRAIDRSGLIRTFAGTGVVEVSGNGGPARWAGFCGPTGLAIDLAGSLYVAGDCGPDGHHIRKIEDGIVTAIVGTGAKGFSGDGGLALEAEINIPSGIAADGAGNLYIADVGNRCIRAVDPAGIITSLWCAER